MRQESTEDLLVIIGMHDADADTEKESKQAFDEFHNRFKNYVYKVSYYFCVSLENRTSVAKDITNDTFLNVWQKASRFDPKRWSNTEKGIKAWLGGIVKNTFLQYVEKAKKYSPENVAIDGYKLTIEEKTPEKIFLNQFQSLEGKALTRALSELKEKEKHILLTYFQFYDGEKFYVPKEDRKILCQLYGIGDSTLRKTKDRAIEKIKKHIIQESPELLPTRLTATNG